MWNKIDVNDSRIEANISNLKRGFGLFRYNWKGMGHFWPKCYGAP